MKSSGWRVVVQDVTGQLHALCKIQPLGDGGYSVICPYHEAREGWLVKLPVGVGYGPCEATKISVENTTHYTASDRVKLSHHRDGLVQFSSERHGTRKYRVLQIVIAVLGILITLAVGVLPLVNLPAAWFVIAVYVLAGSLATVGRLVPVRTF